MRVYILICSIGFRFVDIRKLCCCFFFGKKTEKQAVASEISHIHPIYIKLNPEISNRASQSACNPRYTGSPLLASNERTGGMHASISIWEREGGRLCISVRESELEILVGGGFWCPYSVRCELERRTRMWVRVYTTILREYRPYRPQSGSFFQL